jgi:hypothetical protein
MEPEIGSVFPKNWLRPRFRWLAADATPNDAGIDGGGGAASNLFELHVHVDNQVNDLVVYTASTSWTMPKDMWDHLRDHSVDRPITVTVRGGVFANGALSSVKQGSSGTVSIAPVEAPGVVVYWTTTSGGGSGTTYNPVLKGFRIGDEAVQEVLRPAQLNPDASPTGRFQCVGCHTSSPDGKYVAISARDHNPGGGPTVIQMRSLDGTFSAPPFLTTAAKNLLDRVEQDIPVFSKAHYQPGDRVMITNYSASGKSGPFEIAWTDLEATSEAEGVGWGTFARTGDTGHPAVATPSHDGTRIVYLSSPDVDTAGSLTTTGALYTIPYNNRQGGQATVVQGANDPNYVHGYPSYSPDDKFLAFTRFHANADASQYDNPMNEVYVLPAGGAQTPTRMRANDPPACSGVQSPGAKNSWPKWSPEVRGDGQKSYYFIVFSSARNTGGADLGSQLYISPVVVEGDTITTYSALYLWNQPANEDNHSPAWDTFQIPPTPDPK